MMKFGRCLLLALAAVLVVSAADVASAAAYKDEYKLDLVPSSGTGWGMGAQYFTDLVRERSGGKINIKPYFNAQLTVGKQTNAFMLLRNGTIDFACQSTINYSPQVPELNLFALPFFMSGQPDRYKALDAITNGKAGKLIAKAIDDKGGKFLCFGENGFRELTNSKKEIRVPADLQGLKLRVVGSQLFLDTFKALGSNPVAMPWSDTMSALQQGTIDGQENPINTFFPVKIYEFNKFVTNWHYMGDPTMFVVNPAVWKSFSAEDQELILKAAQDAAKYQIALARVGVDEVGGAAQLEFLKSIGKDGDAPIHDWNAEMARVGMTVTNLTPEETKQFVDLTATVIDSWRDKIGADLIKAAQEDMAAVAK
ncbi:MAG: DctP family TRAP transporter solute-binding subunit [Synergistaceae bacterium]|jgi:tripartite ATP-independent transporter DctP family solute receptor|nr:DctP family TRAP transporter solute-binding subunit [Synergistaceae bacterium]